MNKENMKNNQIAIYSNQTMITLRDKSNHVETLRQILHHKDIL